MNKLKVYKFIVNRKRKMTQGAELGASHSSFAFQQNEDMCIREIQHKFKRLGHQIFLITIDCFDKDSKNDIKEGYKWTRDFPMFS